MGLTRVLVPRKFRKFRKFTTHRGCSGAALLPPRCTHATRILVPGKFGKFASQRGQPIGSPVTTISAFPPLLSSTGRVPAEWGGG